MLNFLTTEIRGAYLSIYFFKFSFHQNCFCNVSGILTERKIEISILT